MQPSTLACLLGAALLLSKRLGSARIMAGVLIGMIVTATLFNQFGDPGNAFAGLSWHWHLVLGSFAFGTIFLATDPVSAAMTDTGRWIYGLLIGAMVVVIRVTNSTHPDGGDVRNIVRKHHGPSHRLRRDVRQYQKKAEALWLTMAIRKHVMVG